MKTYTVVVAGMGKRGLHHAAAFQANPRFRLVGVSDVDKARLEAAAAKVGAPKASANTEALLAELKPDVFCFCTPPSVREPLVRLGIASGAKLIAFEKPIALSSAEAMRIRDLLGSSGIRAVVSHQHRYGEHYRKVKEIIASGALGRVHTVYGTATGWMMHMLTHLIDYMRWFAGEPEACWAMGQASGRGKLEDIHPSPDYIAGFVHFAGGVRGIVECGAGAPDVPEVEYWWRKCRIGAQGTDGFAEVLTGGGYRAVTRAGSFSGPGSMNYDLDMPPYVQEMADWLDDPSRKHSSDFASAYKGFEILAALCRSAAEGGQVALPLSEGTDEIRALRERLPRRPVLLSMEANAKEYEEKR
ncbi:MAG: Gfo/Idh/MocA family protein [Planctomycetota bacterium]